MITARSWSVWTFRISPVRCRVLARRRLSSATPRSFAVLHAVLSAGGASTAKGAIIEDVDGNRFLDFNAGIAVVATGHCHPRVVKAIQEQAARLIHMSGTDFYYEELVALAEKLSEIAPGDVAAPRLVRQFGRRGDGGQHQAGPLHHRARQADRVFRQLPRPHHGRALADGAQGDAARRGSDRWCRA